MLRLLSFQPVIVDVKLPQQCNNIVQHFEVNKNHGIFSLTVDSKVTVLVES